MESWTVSYFEENLEHCRQLLGNRHFLEQIPLLNDLTDCNILDSKVVRFKGMIQDMLTPVYYIEKFHILNTKTNATLLRSGKYRNFVDLEQEEEILHDSSEKVYQEKRIMHCVQVPGLNSWTTQFKYINDQSSISCREEKRKLNSEDIPSINSNNMEVDNNDSNKRFSSKSIIMDQNLNADSDKNVTCARSSNVEQLSTLKHEESGVQNVLLNIYDCKDEHLRVNDAIEVVGFLSVKSTCDHMEEDEMSYFNSLPTIHVIHITSGSSTFDNMLKLDKEHIFENASSLRNDMWLMLTDILLGDTLAADYLLCHLISTVYSHKDSLALGKFSLNLSNVPVTLGNMEYVPAVYRFLAHLLEKSIYLPITIPYLNNTTMIPKKNNEQNRLITGLLQVSPKTHIVVDETKLEPGTLVEKGVRNVHALAEVINTQKIEYDFEFYKLPFNTDIPVLSLSLGKSLLPSDYHLIFEPDESCVRSANESFARAWKKMVDPLLSKLRVYLNNISSLDYNLTTAMQEVIEKDYVKMRQDRNNCTTTDDLHRLLVLSRLISVSHGHKTLQNDVWEYACRIENERKARIR